MKLYRNGLCFNPFFSARAPGCSKSSWINVESTKLTRAVRLSRLSRDGPKRRDVSPSNSRLCLQQQPKRHNASRAWQNTTFTSWSASGGRGRGRGGERRPFLTVCLRTQRWLLCIGFSIISRYISHSPKASSFSVWKRIFPETNGLSSSRRNINAPPTPVNLLPI